VRVGVVIGWPEVILCGWLGKLDWCWLYNENALVTVVVGGLLRLFGWFGIFGFLSKLVLLFS